jgi:D-3-phosphoglycerate dehydrogenase
VSDVISLHISGRKEIKDVINENSFNIMKKGVIIINLSRGYVIDEKLLVKNIKSGKVRGAAIDVFPTEGDSKGKFKSVLQNIPNVILTPHIGGSTEEALGDSGEFVSYHIIQFINTGASKLSVNFPNLTLPDHPNAHRIIHVHKNIPGILAKLNNIMAKNKVNIEGQYLKTNDQIGYVITDINANHKEEVIEELKKIPGTIKVRVLY